MGRAKMDDLMKSQKLRNAALTKRKKGLKKKIYEFSTLCGVDACMILFHGSNHDSNNPNHCLLNEPDDVYPENRGELLRIIRRLQSSEDRSKRSVKLSNDLFEDRKKNKIKKMENCDCFDFMKCDVDEINDLDQDELRELLRSLDSKIDQISSRAAMDRNSFTDPQDIWTDPVFAEPLTYMNPVDYQMPSLESLSDLSPCFDCTDATVPTNSFDCDNLGAGPTWSIDTWPDSVTSPFIISSTPNGEHQIRLV